MPDQAKNQGREFVDELAAKVIVGRHAADPMKL